MLAGCLQFLGGSAAGLEPALRRRWKHWSIVGWCTDPRVGLEILARPSVASYQRPVSSLSPQCAVLGNGASVQWGRGAVNTDRGLLCARPTDLAP